MSAFQGIIGLIVFLVYNEFFSTLKKQLINISEGNFQII